MILLYHSVIPNDSPAERLCAGQALPQAVFEKHIRWLASNHRIVALTEYLAGWPQQKLHKDKPIAITFDDGFGLTFRCISPLLTDLSIPATIFVSTGHLESGQLLWFSYLKALCFEGLYSIVIVNHSHFPLQTIEQRIQAWSQLRTLAKSSGSPIDFCNRLAKAYPLTSEVVSIYAGMTHEQIKKACASGILEIGAHTITHAYLDQLTRENQEQEIQESRRVLSKITRRPIRYFAYPAGDYNHDTLELVKAAGFDASFAVIPKKIGTDPRLEIGRIGIYSQSLLKLQLKTLGVADWARNFGMRVG